MEDDILKKIESKIDKIADDLVEIKIVQVKEQVSLDEHIRRTELLEYAQEEIFEELKPIKMHIGQVNGAFKVIGLLASLASVVGLVFKLFGRL